MRPSQLSAAVATVSAEECCPGRKQWPVEQLSGAHETPPVPTSASGTATLVLNGPTVNCAVSAAGLSGSA
jgi:hypothetical protein